MTLRFSAGVDVGITNKNSLREVLEVKLNLNASRLSTSHVQLNLKCL